MKLASEIKNKIPRLMSTYSIKYFLRQYFITYTFISFVFVASLKSLIKIEPNEMLITKIFIKYMEIL